MACCCSITQLSCASLFTNVFFRASVSLFPTGMDVDVHTRDGRLQTRVVLQPESDPPGINKIVKTYKPVSQTGLELNS